MSRCYIAGPMTGYPNMNFDAFNKKAKELRKVFKLVVNPVDINPNPDADWSDCMDYDLDALSQCTHIYLLQGWSKSKGARIEYKVATILGLEIQYDDYNEWVWFHHQRKVKNESS